ELDLPMFRPKLDPIPEVVRSVAREVAWADAYLIGSPDYHGSMSGAIKNFLDYHWKEFAGKLFGHVCASHEKGLTAMDQMRTAVRQCYGWSLPYGLALHPDQDIDHAGEFSPKLRHRLDMLVRDLLAYGTLIRGQFDHDLAEKTADTFAAHYRR
ncbi:NADPH-dependent FMN reductase, partial [Singulisphaera rosea]